MSYNGVDIMRFEIQVSERARLHLTPQIGSVKEASLLVYFCGLYRLNATASHDISSTPAQDLDMTIIE
jgi:hypothetical protein